MGSNKNRKKNRHRGDRVSRKRNTAVATMPLLTQPKNNRVSRSFATLSSLDSDATGSHASSIDLGLLLYNHAEFGRMIEVYKTVRVFRVHVEFVPLVFHFRADSTSLIDRFATVAVGYSPDDSSNPTSTSQVLDLSSSLWLSTDRRYTMSFSPLYNKGSTAPTTAYQLSQNAEIGSLWSASGTGTCPPEVSVWAVRIRFDTYFQYAG